MLYEFGPFRVDTADRQLSRAGERLALTPRTFDLLVVFLQSPGLETRAALDLAAYAK